MKNIAICDDIAETAESLAVRVGNIVKKYDENIKVYTYNSGFALGDDIERGMAFDLVFMDIVLGDDNGIKVSEKVLKQLNGTKVIFITGYMQYVEDIFEVTPFGLLMKPIDEKKLTHLLDKAILQNNKRDENIVIKTSEGIYKIDVNNIICAESDGKYLIITDKEKKVYRTIMTMEEFEEKSYRKLARCHRCSFINMIHVRTIENNVAKLEGNKEIQISRKYNKEIKHLFMDVCGNI